METVIDLIARQVTKDQPPAPGVLEALLQDAARTGFTLESMGLTRHHRVKTRNAALAEAAAILSVDSPGPWPLACRLAAAIQRFQSCSWPRLQHGGSGDQLGPVDRCLWRAHLAGDKVPSTARWLYRLLN